jgi:hypothetical protein
MMYAREKTCLVEKTRIRQKNLAGAVTPARLHYHIGECDGDSISTSTTSRQDTKEDII